MDILFQVATNCIHWYTRVVFIRIKGGVMRVKHEYCIICGKKLGLLNISYCGSICAAIGKARKNCSKWLQSVTIEQARHWYRT